MNSPLLFLQWGALTVDDAVLGNGMEVLGIFSSSNRGKIQAPDSADGQRVVQGKLWAVQSIVRFLCALHPQQGQPAAGVVDHGSVCTFLGVG